MHGKSKSRFLIALSIAFVLFLTSCNGGTTDPSVLPPEEDPPSGDEPPPVGSALTTSMLITLIGQNLASGAVKSAGSAGFGWVLNMLGLGDPVAQTTIALLETINLKLDELTKSVGDMQRQLNDVDYNALASPLLPIVSKITGANTAFFILANLPPVTEDTSEADKAFRQKTIADLSQRIGGPDGIMANQYAIRDAMLGTGMAGGGMIVKWSKVVVGRQHFFNRQSSDMQQEMYNYWLTLQAIQETLIIEYMHYENYPSNIIEQELAAYNLSIEEQKKWIPWELPTNLSKGNNESTLIIVPCKPYAIMFDTNIFRKGNYTYAGVTGILNVHNQNQPAYAWQTYPMTVWTLPDGRPDGKKLRSDMIEAIFKNIPENKSVKNWAAEQGWKEFPVNTGSVFSIWTEGTVVGPPIERMVYSFEAKGLVLAPSTSQHCLLLLRRLPNRDDVNHKNEFYFYH